MAVCSNCGQDNPGPFRFCGACGVALDATPREVRKTVTVLFCDLTGSTALGDRLDPEALRATMRRYHAQLRRILEHHGGTVEKFVGDAVMAVFGIPQAHEDDALRAVRAAAEMRDAVAELGLEARIGVNTGEVVTGEGETLVTGDAVNVAARLEQSAEPGQILLGSATQALVRDAVSVTSVELELKGKSGRVAAFRLIGVDHAAPGFSRRFDAPLVGRERELRLLGEAFAQTVDDRACHLFTLLGPAGVGKSRLVHEFLGELEARVLRGRCLPYGDGITFWPLVEVLKELGEPAAPTLARIVEGDVASVEALFWDVRKLVEGIARERPLVIVFEDLQWAEPTFLDLLDHVADLSRDAPILLLCLARPDLLEERQGWGGGKLNATTVLLEPLTSDESRGLVAGLVAGGLDEEAIAHVVRASEGNPLFLEEMVALVAESGEVTVPPTIRAIVASRLDRLAPDERAVIERGAVEGQVFHRSAVVELAPPPPRAEVDGKLVALVRKDLVRSVEPVFADDDAFRFRHLLIRDVAYESLPKELRSELHERFGDWLDRHPELVELDELVGYHLEQAARYRRELGREDALLDARAGERLAAAGLRAAARSDVPGSCNLLARALELVPDGHPARAELLLGLGTALEAAGQFAAAEQRLSDAIETARAAGDPVAELRAVLRRVEVRVFAEEASFTDGRAEVEVALDELERLGDDRALAEAWLLAAKMRSWLGDVSGSDVAYEHAIERAERIGDRRIVSDACGWLAWNYLTGPLPADRGLIRTGALRERFGADPIAELWLDIVDAGLTAMCGRTDEGAGLLDVAVARAYELGMPFMGAASLAEVGYYLERVADRPAEAERRVRSGYESLAAMGERGMLSTRAAFLADSLYRLGRLDEAASLVEEAAELGASDDLMTEVMCLAVRAKILARRGDGGEAERLARQAVALVEQTEWLDQHARCVEDLGEVLSLTGKREEGALAFAAAAALYERKGVLTVAERLRGTGVAQESST
jgi:class 3 adenylate cyclase/tetratricopeptide (TPR) repeat protein